MFVIFSHAFGFSGMADPMYAFTGNLPGGQFAVYVFFVLSGYLLTDSWFKRPQFISYFSKRMLRIFPALFVCVLLTIFFFGPVLTNLSLLEYFSSPETYSYIQNITLWKLQFELPGVVLNDELLTVNATLWTLVFEFMMYVILPLLSFFTIITEDKRRVWILWVIYISMLVLHIIGIPKDLVVFKIIVFNFVRLFLYFYAGVLFRMYFKERKPETVILIGSLVLFVITRQTILFEASAVLFITCLVFWIGFYPKKILAKYFNGNDYSYGLYLYGYICQNIIQKHTGDMIPLFLKIPLSILFAFVFAYLSWHLIESKALRLKRWVSDFPLILKFVR